MEVCLPDAVVEQGSRKCSQSATARGLDKGSFRAEATLKLSLEVMKLLSKPAPAQFGLAARTKTTPDKQRWTRVTIPIESLNRAVGELLAPRELRRKMAEIAAGMGTVYAGVG